MNTNYLRYSPFACFTNTTKNSEIDEKGIPRLSLVVIQQMKSMKLKKEDRIFGKLQFFRMLYKVKNKRQSTIFYFRKRVRVFRF